MNRAPGKSDASWPRHESECGGRYTKISEPDVTRKQLEAMSAKERAGRQKNKLDGWVKASAGTGRAEGGTSALPVGVDGGGETSTSSGRKRKAAALLVDDGVKQDAKKSRPDDSHRNVESKALVECPICIQKVAEAQINEHLDDVHLS